MGSFSFLALARIFFASSRVMPSLRGNQTLRGHGFLDLLGKICLELQVAVGDDTDQLSALCDRDTGNAELCHQLIGIRQGMLRG